MQIMRNFLFLVLILSQFFVGAQQKKQKKDEKISYEVINFHFQDSDTIKLFNTTIGINEMINNFAMDDDALPYNFYESLSYFHKPLLGSQEIDTLLNINEKALFNKYFSKLSKVKLKKKKLNKNIQLFPLKKWRTGYEQITFPFHIESNGILYSFFFQDLSDFGGEFYIYQFKNGKYALLYEMTVYFE